MSLSRETQWLLDAFVLAFARGGDWKPAYDKLVAHLVTLEQERAA